MKRKILVLLTLAIVTAVSYLSTVWLPESSTTNLFQSSLAVTVLYAIFSLGVSEFFARRLSDSKTRYSFRKAVSLILIVLVLVVLLRIWVPNPQALLVAYGVVAAGIAVALQDVVKNLAGSITIFLSGLYRVGNRIELNGVFGDVIDIGIFNTTLLEIRNWIDADQATGRIVTVPNGAVLNSPLHNFTKQHSYLWDELRVVVTSESNWSDAMRLMAEVGEEHTKDFIAAADESLTKLERYYYVEGRVLEPNVYITGSADGYALTLRYVVDAWRRRTTNSNIWGHLIRVFEEHGDIVIAPTTIASVDYPQAK
ncbi:mechanosensitive ion channel family protein [Candidatus Pacebacteria bacterium]|nr:mechanosensitive ion channel family protein [Candidatus Paceibacterota bacterium]